MKLAIVHDFLLSYGGAERVIEQVHEIFPTAPIFTLRYNAKKMHHKMDGWDIRSSFVDNIPIVKDKGHTLAMNLYPLAIESFDFKEYDIVLSFSSTFAHGIITQPKTTHICYYHTPARFLWDYHFSYLKEKGWENGFKAPYAKKFLHKLRIWDYLAAQRPDVCFANSNTIKDRVSKFYRRESDTIYPGVEVDNYNPTKKHQDYYVTVCRLTKPKRVELAIEASTKLQLPLHVIGTGEELENLKAIAGPTIKFCGFLNDKEVADELASAKALLWPNIDDFGLVPVEAMASGTPVVAYNMGGATETVVHGKTGVLFNDQTVDGLIEGIQELDKILPNPDAKVIRAHAEQFSKIAFQKNIKAIVDKEYQKLNAKNAK